MTYGARNRRGERGQAAVMIALMLGILIIFVAFSINAGLIVNDRIRIQNTADLAAYAGAAKQAEILNEINAINDDIMTDVVEFRQFLFDNSVPWNMLTYDTGSPCVCDAWTNPGMEGRITAFQGQLAGYHARILSENTRNGEVWSATRNTAEANYEGTSGKVRPISHRTGDAVMPLKLVSQPFRYATWDYICCLGVPCGTQPCGVNVTPHEFDTWAYKAYGGSGDGKVTPGGGYNGYNDTVNVVALTDVEPTHGLVDFPNQVFRPDDCSHTGAGMGSNGNCKMNAYAAARPFVGKIGTIEDSGPSLDTMQIQVSQQLTGMPANCLGPCISEIMMIRVIERRQTTTYRDYQVRPTGVFEGESKQAGTVAQWENQVFPSEARPAQGNIKH